MFKCVRSLKSPEKCKYVDKEVVIVFTDRLVLFSTTYLMK